MREEPDCERGGVSRAAWLFNCPGTLAGKEQQETLGPVSETPGFHALRTPPFPGSFREPGTLPSCCRPSAPPIGPPRSCHFHPGPDPTPGQPRRPGWQEPPNARTRAQSRPLPSFLLPYSPMQPRTRHPRKCPLGLNNCLGFALRPRCSMAHTLRPAGPAVGASAVGCRSPRHGRRQECSWGPLGMPLASSGRTRPHVR